MKTSLPIVPAAANLENFHEILMLKTALISQFYMKNVGNFRRLRRPATSNDIFSKSNLGKLRKSPGNNRKFAACGGDFFQFPIEKLGFFSPPAAAIKKFPSNLEISKNVTWKFPKMFQVFFLEIIFRKCNLEFPGKNLEKKRYATA